MTGASDRNGPPDLAPDAWRSTPGDRAKEAIRLAEALLRVAAFRAGVALPPSRADRPRLMEALARLVARD